MKAKHNTFFFLSNRIQKIASERMESKSEKMIH